MELRWSPYADRSGDQRLHGAALHGNQDIALFLDGPATIAKVDFYIDGSYWNDEARCPWDLNGTQESSTGHAVMFTTPSWCETRKTMVVSAAVTLHDGTSAWAEATFSVGPTCLVPRIDTAPAAAAAAPYETDS